MLMPGCWVKPYGGAAAVWMPPHRVGLPPYEPWGMTIDVRGIMLQRRRAFAEDLIRMQDLVAKAAPLTGEHHQRLWRNALHAFGRASLLAMDMFPFMVDFESAKAAYAEQLGEELTFEQERVAMVMAFMDALEEAFGNDG